MVGDVRELIVRAEEATSAALEGFGSILGRSSGAPAIVSEFMPEVELRKPVSFVSDDKTILSLATVHRRPLEVLWLERHYKHTQTFIPLGGRPFVLAMAKPTTTDFPDPGDVRAFLFDGSAGFTMNIGTWHEFPFALADPTDVVVILRSETNQNLQNIADNEAHGDDLDKRDLARRAGARITLVV
jgi:ureidoglycolate lyase